MVMVLQKRGNVFFHNKQHKGGSIQIHHVSENENELSLPGGLATKLTSITQKYNPVATNNVAKVNPHLEIGGNLQNMHIHFRRKNKKIKLKTI